MQFLKIDPISNFHCDAHYSDERRGGDKPDFMIDVNFVAYRRIPTDGMRSACSRSTAAQRRVAPNSSIGTAAAAVAPLASVKPKILVLVSKHWPYQACDASWEIESLKTPTNREPGMFLLLVTT